MDLNKKIDQKDQHCGPPRLKGVLLQS